MRVIAGLRRGLKLRALEGTSTRPTTDRVKESVFNIIQTRLPSERVLDLFSGSGALGIEALSRGCEKCIFVEQNKGAMSVIRQNISLSHFDNLCETYLSDALKYLATEPLPFDIIFLDPPYNKGFMPPVLDKIHKGGLLKKDGIIVAETEKDGEAVSHFGYKKIKEATYGSTVITVLTRGDSE